MKQSLVYVTLVVRDYDEAIAFFTQKLKFGLIEDTYQPDQDKRWVVVAPPGSVGTSLLLAKAASPDQVDAIGNQTGGRVFLFLRTDDFWRDYRQMSDWIVAVFEDLYGNPWDLIGPNTSQLS
jgi:catechol 2,3-dioxygenase-like lactoylglutathione lyase family enzyme